MTDGKFDALGAIVAGVIGLMMGVALGACIRGYVEVDRWQKHVIQHNAAEWRCDPQTGEREFYWLVGDEEKDTQ